MTEKKKRADEAPEAEEVAAPAAEEQPAPEADRDPDRLMDRLRRVTAEYENYRKRVAREKASWTAQAVESVLLDMLPVLDSFDRALASMGDAVEVRAVLDGMELVRKQLEGALRAHGVESVDALGEVFDPNLHEAFLSRPAEEGEAPGTIVEEFLKGYRLHERTLRPTKGIVAAAPETDRDSDSSAEEDRNADL